MVPRATRAPARGAAPGAPPRVVALGGGTGLPNVLRGLRPLLYADGAAHEIARDRLVAIVATSDDGGSSGKLRAEFNIIPPGDIRNCLAALSDNQRCIADIFQYRFGSGEGLNGHTARQPRADCARRRDERLSARPWRSPHASSARAAPCCRRRARS